LLKNGPILPAQAVQDYVACIVEVLQHRLALHLGFSACAFSESPRGMCVNCAKGAPRSTVIEVAELRFDRLNRLSLEVPSARVRRKARASISRWRRTNRVRPLGAVALLKRRLSVSLVVHHRNQDPQEESGGYESRSPEEERGCSIVIRQAMTQARRLREDEEPTEGYDLQCDARRKRE
jgi:hypothetical protein